MSTMFGNLGQTSAPDNSPADPAAGAQAIAVDYDAPVEAANPTADFNEIIPPPPAGLYLFKWSVDEKGIVGSVGKKPPHSPFLNCFLLGNLFDDGGPDDGFKVNYYFNSLVQSRKGTSEAHHFLSCAGNPAPAQTTLGRLKAQLEETLASNPVVPAELQWRCSYKNPTTGKWDEQFTRMDQFPKHKRDDGKWDGTYENVAASKLDNSPLYAQAHIVRIIAEAEYRTAKK